MPISEKIVSKILEADENTEFKKLMMQILQEADKGNFRVKAEFEKIVKNYIDKNKLSEEKSND